MATLRDIMTPDPIAVRANTPLSEAAALLDTASIRHLPVLDGDRVVGILSDRDLAAWRANPTASATVREVAHTDVVYLDAQRPVRDAIDLMTDRHIGAIPVTEGGKLVGIVSFVDLLALLRSLLT